MKKLILLMFVPLLMVSLNSCNPETKEVPKPKLVKTMTSQGFVVEFKYDKDNRVTEVIESDNGTVIEKIRFTYGDQVISIKNDIYTEQDMVLRLNDEGYVIKVEGTQEGEPIAIDHTYSNGKLATTSCLNVDILSYTWEKGNLSKIIDVTEGIQGMTITCNDKENKQNIIINEILYGFPEFLQFKGLATKNLPVKYVYDDGDIITFSYTFDKDGYVLSETTTYPGSQPITIIYGYYE